MKSEAAHKITCRARSHKDEATAKRCLWAWKQNFSNRAPNTTPKDYIDNCEVKYCNLCQSWHIVRKS